MRRDGAATYQRILVTAGMLFAESDFGETASKSIAAKGKVDLASINYHFGSRNGLYQAVLAEAHRWLISMETLEGLNASGVSAAEKLRKIIEGIVDAAKDRSGCPARVLVRELLSPSSHLQVLQQQEVFSKLQLMLGILSEITSIPVGDPALLRCLISVAAPAATLFVLGSNSPTIASMMANSSREEMIDHLYCFAMGGLKQMGGEA